MRGKARSSATTSRSSRRWSRAGACRERRAAARSRRVPIDDAYVERSHAGIKLGTRAQGRGRRRQRLGAGRSACKRCAALGSRPMPLYCDMDGAFPNHHPDPTVPENLDDADRARARRKGATSASPGTATATASASSTRTARSSGATGCWCCSRAIIAAHSRARPFIGEVKCSQTLFDDIAKHGGRPIMWKTGHSLIKTKMKEEQARRRRRDERPLLLRRSLLRLRRRASTRRCACSRSCRRERRSAERAACATCRAGIRTPEIRVDCPDDIKFEVVERRARARCAARGELIDIDGVRVHLRRRRLGAGARFEHRPGARAALRGADRAERLTRSAPRSRAWSTKCAAELGRRRCGNERGR